MVKHSGKESSNLILRLRDLLEVIDLQDSDSDGNELKPINLPHLQGLNVTNLEKKAYYRLLPSNYRIDEVIEL